MTRKPRIAVWRLKDERNAGTTGGNIQLRWMSPPLCRGYAESAGHRKPVANGVDIAAFNHALFDAYISVDQ